MKRTTVLKSAAVLGALSLTLAACGGSSETAASSAGYALMTSYERSLRKELEEKGKIWENPEYLSLGRNRGAQTGEDTGG